MNIREEIKKSKARTENICNSCGKPYVFTGKTEFTPAALIKYYRCECRVIEKKVLRG